MTKLFGGGGNQEATRAAERARAAQQVANDRQLAELRTSDENTDATRRNPRGRKLFVSASEGKTDLS